VGSAGYSPCGTLAYFTRPDAYLGWLSADAGADLDPPRQGSAGDVEPHAAAAAGLEALAAHLDGCAVGAAPPGAWPPRSTLPAVLLLHGLLARRRRLRTPSVLRAGRAP